MNKELLHRIRLNFPISPILVTLFGLFSLGLIDEVEIEIYTHLTLILLFAIVVFMGIMWWDLKAQLNVLENKIVTATITTGTK